MTRPLLLGLALALVLVTVPALPAADAVVIETFRDEFNSNSWAGNDGDRDFLAPWTKLPGSNHIELVGQGVCVATRCMKLGEKAAVLTGQGISRGANLTGAQSATLTFRYRRLITSPTTTGVQLLAGQTPATLSQLWTLSFDATDPSFGTATISLDPYISSTTHIAFHGWGVGGIDGQVFIDNVEIAANFGNAPVIDPIDDREDEERDNISFQVEATDADGDPLTYSASGLPPGVSINSSTGVISGQLTYAAANNSPHSVTVSVSDGSSTSSDTFVWTVEDLNRPPTIEQQSDATIPEGSQWTRTVAASDPDTAFGDTLTFSLDQAPAGMTIGATTGVIKWTPSESAGPGTYQVTVTVTDASEAEEEDDTSFDVIVNEVNAAPVITDIPDQLSGRGDTISLPLSATDSDIPANTLTFQASGLPPGLQVSGSKIVGVIGDTATVHLVTVTVSDNGVPVRSDGTTFTWTAAATNRAPVLDPISDQTLASDGFVRFTARATDPDGDDVAYSLTGAPSGASINPNTGAFQWRPSDAQRGKTYSVTVVATDDGLPSLSTSLSVSIEVPEANVAPAVVDPGAQQSVEGVAVTLTIDADDGNEPPDTLTFSATGLPPGLSIHPATGVVSGTIDYTASDGSPYDVEVTVVDDGTPSLSDSTVFTWTVEDVNRPPLLGGPSTLRVLTGATQFAALTISDPDGDPVAVAIVDSQTLGFASMQGNQMRYVAGATAGFDSVRIRASDGEAVVFLSISIEVVVDQNPPIAADDAYETFVDERLVVESPGVLGNDDDPDGTPLTAELVTAPPVGEVSLDSDGSLTYTPPTGFVGVVDFDYEASDGFATSRATVRIRVRVQAGIIDPTDRIGLVTRGDPIPAQPEPTPSRSAIVSRSFVALARSASIQVDMLAVPLILLAGLALLAMTIGRFGSTPLLYSRLRSGTLASLHADGFGHLEGDDGNEYFFSLETVGARDMAIGDRVRFRSISAEPRDLAVVVRPIT